MRNDIRMVKLKNKTSKYWYFILLLFVFYFTLPQLIPSVPILSQATIFLILLLGFTSLFKVLFLNKKRPGLFWWVFMILVLLFFSFLTSSPTVFSYKYLKFFSTLEQFKVSITFFLTLFTGYAIGQKKNLPFNEIKDSSVILVLLAIFLFFTNLFIARSLGEGEFTNNSAYNFLIIIPYIPLLWQHKKKFSLFLLSVIFVFVLLAAKRGAILCLVISIVYLYRWYTKYYGLNVRDALVILLLLIAMVGYALHTYEDSVYIQERINSTLAGNSSGRDTIYETLWLQWLHEKDLITQLFGYGMSKTVAFAGNYAHNDWLELLIDQGLVGVICYLMIFVSIFIFIRKYAYDKYVMCSMMLWCITWFAKSIFSMGYPSAYNGIGMLLLGLQIGNCYRIRQLKRHSLKSTLTTK